MEVLFDPINFILLIAAITILWWLKSVLGQRTGLERTSKQIEIIPPSSKLNTQQDRPIKTIVEDWAQYAEPGSTLSSRLETLRKVQPEFSIGHFLDGAKSAHEMILVAFSKGDKKSLKPLLSQAVYDSFEKAIDQDNAARNTKIFKFVGINSAKLYSAEVEKKTLALGVKFESEIISASLNANKELVSGDEKAVSTLKECWIFERDLNSKDPNWILAATQDSTAIEPNP
jgi:predicted lipid-binding transport protein (Tim44 family)